MDKKKIFLGLALTGGAVHVLDALKITAITDLVNKSWYSYSGYDLTLRLIVGAAIIVLAVMELKKR